MFKIKHIITVILILISTSFFSFNLVCHSTSRAYSDGNLPEIPYYIKKNSYKGVMPGVRKNGGWGWRGWYSYYTPRYSRTYNYPWYIEGYYYPWWYYGYLPYYYWWY